MNEKIRWGILGSGRIAKALAHGLSVLPDAELAAVGSRSQESADAFGDRYDVPRRHPSYLALANDPEIDVIYVATPHNLHKENTLLCLEAGKPVICEKPFAVNATEAREMVGMAREREIFLMEGMWARFPPGMVKVRQLIADGTLGELRSLQADFGFRAKNRDPEGRLFNPTLAGGALLDIGIYPVSLSSMLFGKPEEIVSTWHRGETGVDEQSAYLFRHSGGALSVMHSSLQAETTQETVIAGTKARLRIERPCWRPQEIVLTRNDDSEKRFSHPFEGNGFNYEAAEVMRLLRAGEKESSVMSLDESIAIMETLDAIRGQWGLRYPME
ncbi:MAG: Gfo/Idh/MocA family oxidoreductase [Opitutales bacterium]